MAFNTLIQQEIELSQRVSEEEWEEIRPSRIDRRQSMISFIKVKIIIFKIIVVHTTNYSNTDIF